MLELSEHLLRKHFSEIVYGFSIFHHDNSKRFLKHFSTIDSLEIDFLYSENYKKVAARGYPTEQERLTQLEKDRLWTQGDENNIEGLRAAIKNFVLVKRKAFLKRDIESINEQSAEQEKILKEMLIKRETLIGPTVEKFARKNVDAYLIFKSFYQDIELTQLVYSKEEFDDLDSSELDNLFAVYNEIMNNFSELNIRKIALSPFFQNAFALSDNIYQFYGKPICYLTNYQIQLAAYGGYYKAILSSENKPPDNVLNDPDKLEDWYSSKSNVEQMLDKNVKQDGTNVSIVGATKEDLKNWGYDQQDISLREATKKAGGTLTQEEMMKLYGVE